MSLSFHHVTFTFDGALSPLFEDMSAHFPQGWTSVAGPNGAGKTTALHLAAGLLQAQQGSIIRPERIVLCPQRTDAAPDGFERFTADLDPEACILRGKLQIGDDWARRWSTLSHGERKRAQIGTALHQAPDALLLDEPTNHIDYAARRLLAEALESFPGIGLLVGHDRELLDRLCSRCLFLDPPQAVMRPGNYTEAAAEAEREEESLKDKRHVLQQKTARLEAEAKQRQAKAARADKRNTKRHLARGDSDGRARINQTRVLGKDGKAGRLADQMMGRISQARQEYASITIKKRSAVNFRLEGSLSPRPRLFSIPAETLDLGDGRKLMVPEFSMLRDDRIAVTGRNGLGKSTLIRYLLDRIEMPREQIVYLPQEIDTERTREIMHDVHRLSNEQLGTVMTVVGALGSRPDRLLRNVEASPGELRKLLLALGILRRPHLIIMDEPTNHLDLPAIECLENALRHCPCALLLISHDMRFLSAVARKRRHLRLKGTTVSISEELPLRSK